MNRPESFESYVLEEDEKKLDYTKDLKAANTGTFKILKEDHTAGNLIRMQLLRDPAVQFAGYKIPHPLLHELDVKIRTNGTKSTWDAMTESLAALIKTTKDASASYEQALANYKRGPSMRQ